jgi:spore coat protein A
MTSIFARAGLFSIIIALGATVARAARAETVTEQAVMDTTLYEETPSASDGAGAYLFSGNNGDADARHGLIAFDVGAVIPPGSTIQSAELSLYVSRTRPGASNFSLYKMTAPWGEASSNPSGNEGAGVAAAEGDATWSHRDWPNTPWATPGGDFDATVKATTLVGDAGTYYAWSDARMVDDVQSWVDDPVHNFGWVLIGDSAEAGTAKQFGSHNGDRTVSPQLTIVFTPPGQPIGACCAPDGSCGYVLAPGTACYGSYQGTGSACAAGVCAPPVAVCCQLDATAACAIKNQADCVAGKGKWREALSSCQPNPCTAALTPFVDPLPMLPVATPVAQSATKPEYRLAMVERQQQLHRDLPATTVWGFDDGTLGGTYPGPTVEARAGAPIRVTWANDLRDLRGSLRTTHFLPVDSCLSGASSGAPGTVIHLHGGHVPSEFDGQPDAALLPGAEAAYEYPNNQAAATLWYHDDALGTARLNVLMGLAGFYILRDDAEDALGLPAGKYDVPLLIQDRSFRSDGSFAYPPTWQEHFFGDTVLVNGKAWPYLDVDRGAYRFRLLNGSNSRTYTLTFSPFVYFVQIGSDGGLLRSGVAKPSVTISPGERADVIVDFGAMTPGQKITLLNTAQAPYPNGDEENRVDNVMQFVVTDGSGPSIKPLVNLRTIAPLAPATAVISRDIELDRSDDDCGGGRWRINGAAWSDDITETPRIGTTEIWRFINKSGVAHPMHLHLVQFQLLDRQPFMVQDDEPVLTGTPTGPALEEAGWKDTILVPGFQVTRIIARFQDYAGRFTYTCQALEHEDHEMVRPFQVCGDGGCPTQDAATDGVDAADNAGCRCGLAMGQGGRVSRFGSALLVLIFGIALTVRRRTAKRAARRSSAACACAYAPWSIIRVSLPPRTDDGST